MRASVAINLESSLQGLSRAQQTQCAQILHQGKAAAFECLKALLIAKKLGDDHALKAVEDLIKKDGNGVYAEEKAAGIKYIAEHSPESIVNYINAATKVSGQTYRAAVQELGYDLSAVLERAIITIPPIELIPEDKIHREDEGEKSKVRGSLGTVLKREVYRIFDPQKPQQVGFFAWSQATRNLIAAFNPKLFEKIEQKEKDQKNSKREVEDQISRILKTLPSITIDYAKEVLKKSPTVVYERMGSLLKDLQSAIDQAKGELSNLTEGEALISVGVDKPRIRGDGGGQLLGWFERFNGDLPKIIKNDLDNIRSRVSTENDETRRERVLRLVSFRALHTYVETETAIAGIIQDLDLFKDEHPEEASSFRGKHHNLLHSDSGEISVTEANTILLDAESIRDFRTAKNRELLEVYGEEFLEALNYFKPLFLESDGGWREDSQGTSFPRSRLKQTVFGATTLKGDKSVLNQNSWKLIMKGIELEMAYPDARLAEGMSIQDFKTVIEGVVESYRRVKLFRDLLNEEGKDLAPLNGIYPGKSPTDDKTEINVEVYGSDLKIAGFPKNLKLIESLPFSIEEIFDRIDDLAKRKYHGKIEAREASSFKSEISKYSSIGLYEEAPKVQSFLNQISELTLASTITSVNDAEEIFASPFFFAAFPATEIFDENQKVRWKYLDRVEVTQIETIAALKDEHPTLTKEQAEEAKNLREKFQLVEFVWIPSDKKRFDFAKRGLYEKLREQKVISSVKFIIDDYDHFAGEIGDPLRVLLALRSLDSNYSPLSEVLKETPDFHERLVIAASTKSRERLAPFGLEVGSSINLAMGIKSHAESLIRSPKQDTVYLGKKFVSRVNEIYLAGYFLIQNDEIKINFGKHKGQNAFDVVKENDWYITAMTDSKKSYPTQVVELASALSDYKSGSKTKDEVLELARSMFTEIS